MDKSKLIAKHLDDKLFITKGSVEYYLETGKVNGVLRGILIEMLQEFESEVRGQHPKLKNGKLPIQRVSNLTCRCGKPYSQKDLQDGMCHKCCAPTG